MNFVGEIWSNIANLFCPIFFLMFLMTKVKLPNLRENDMD